MYDACPECEKYADSAFRWRNSACCLDHAQYYKTLIQYSRKQITKEQAQQAIKDLNINIENIWPREIIYNITS